VKWLGRARLYATLRGVRHTLESSPALRLMTLCAMYLAQGMPFGFVAGTLAAYLATQGYELADVARVTFMAQLPWTFKFIWGPIIDRYDFSEFGLGRRRPWILLAQSMMVTTLMMILFLPDLSQAMTTLVWIIAIHNVFASLQDVSVDALAVDLLPEKERGKANGFMRAASYLGSIIGGSVMGIITARHGLQLAIVLQVAIMLLVMCAPLFLRERAGERLFPWQPKGAAPKPPSSARKSTESFSSIRQSLNKAFSLKSTRLAALLAIVVLAGTTLLSAVSKILILDKLGWSLEAYSKWITGFGYFFALGGALLGGVLADLFTARRVAGVATVVLGAVWVGFSLLEPQWANRSVIVGYIFAEQFCIGIMTVSLYAIFMGVSWPAIAATQFTAYMALLNLSLTGGTRLAGMMGNEPDFRLIYLAAGAVQIVFLFLIRWIDVSETRRILGEEAADASALSPAAK